ncbi:pectinesterase-like [Apium graveolens]|uniref:pectinesterase-like n=1 Tax=Apium graveolens TaxID=4045 RepID=UPI003D7A1893
MPTLHSPNLFLCFLVIMLVFFSPTTSAASIDTICDDTPFPIFCKTLLPNNNASINDLSRFSVQQSISMTQNVLSLLSSYLGQRSTLSNNVIQALEDCQNLCNLNMDFLSETLQAISSTDTIEKFKGKDLLTFLSAIVTDMQTCLGGLEDITLPSSLEGALVPPLSNGSMMYSVALAIFKNGWVENVAEGRILAGRKPPPSTGGLKLYPGGNSVKVSQTVSVDPNGSGNFTTINDAIAVAPNNTDGTKGYFVIRIAAGVYEEYINITKTKRYLMMIGDGINQTVVTGNRSVTEGWSTFNTGTMIVVGQGFVAVNMTFRNTAEAINHQAVAVRSGADLSTFYRCSFEAYQDTLYTHSLRQFYRECDIYGTIDFIFGNAAVVLQNCNIYPRLPMEGQFNAITAQGRTDINQNTGTSIQNCTITQAENLGSTKTYLGRPWKLYSRALYMQSYMDSLIEPAGWSIWSGDFALNTSYYAEYNNRGPGTDTSNRVTWEGFHLINATDAVNFTVTNFISGDSWLPATGVPYYGGL